MSWASFHKSSSTRAPHEGQPPGENTEFPQTHLPLTQDVLLRVPASSPQDPTSTLSKLLPLPQAPADPQGLTVIIPPIGLFSLAPHPCPWVKSEHSCLSAIMDCAQLTCPHSSPQTFSSPLTKETLSHLSSLRQRERGRGASWRMPFGKRDGKSGRDQMGKKDRSPVPLCQGTWTGTKLS